MKDIDQNRLYVLTYTSHFKMCLESFLKHQATIAAGQKVDPEVFNKILRLEMSMLMTIQRMSKFADKAVENFLKDGTFTHDEVDEYREKVLDTLEQNPIDPKTITHSKDLEARSVISQNRTTQ